MITHPDNLDFPARKSKVISDIPVANFWVIVRNVLRTRALLISLAIFQLSPLSFATTITVQPFQLNDGSKIWGVVVRQDSRTFTVALPDEIITIKRRDIAIPGSMSTEAYNVNQLLTMIETTIENEELERVTRMLDPLAESIHEFEEMAKPFIDSNIETPQKKEDCLRRAIAFYHLKRKGFPASIRALKLSKNTIDLERKFEITRGAVRPSLLGEIISAKSEFSKLDALTDKAERSKVEALETLSRLYKETFNGLRRKAMERFSASRRSSKLLKLLTTLAEGADTPADYQSDFSELIKAALIVVAESRDRLNLIAAESLTQTEGTILMQKMLSQRVSELRSVNKFLVSAKRLAFGSEKDSLIASLAQQLKLNEDALESAASKKSVISQTRSDLRQAMLMLQKGQADAAYAQFQKLNADVVDSQLPPGEIRTAIENGLTESYANVLLNRMRNPESFGTGELEQLVTDSEAFVNETSDQLADFDISTIAFRKLIGDTANYRMYKVRYDNVINNLSASPLSNWSRIMAMSNWLETVDSDIHPDALKRWDQFCDEHEMSICKDAVAAFLKDRTALNSDDWKMYKSFVQIYLDTNELDTAVGLIQTGIGLLSATGGSEALLKELLILLSDAAGSYVTSHNLERALELYQSIEGQFPEFSEEYSVGDKVSAQLLALGKSALADGLTRRALELFVTLADRYPAFAERERLYDKIIDLQTARLTVNGRKDTRVVAKILDDICAKYSGYVNNISIIRDTGLKVVDRFDQVWSGGNYDQAVSEYLEFESEFPAFSKETGLIRQIIRRIGSKVYRILQETRKLGKPMPNSLILALQELTQKYPVISHENKVDLLFVDVKLQRANEFIRTGQVVRAFEIFGEILDSNPDIAQDKNLHLLMEKLKWKYNIERIFTPIGITGALDWLAFAITLLLWPLLLYRATVQGREKGHLYYRWVHFTTTFVIFLTLVTCFLFGKYPYYKAFALGFILPQGVFLCFGFATYLCFPLIYCERFLVFERAVVGFINRSWLRRILLFRKYIGIVQRDIDRRENDLPLLHDRTLYKIEKASHLASLKPEKGQEQFNKIVNRLKQELVKTTSWKKNYAVCLYNLGAIADHLGQKEEALNYLTEHLEFEPKHIETRRILGELLYEKREFDKAIRHIKVCLAAYGRDEILWFKLGRCFFETGNYVAAYKCFASTKSTDRDTYFYAARSYSKAGELEKAVTWYQKLLKQHPHDSEAIYYLAISFSENSEDQKALKIINLLKQDDPYFARGRVMIGNILFRSRKLKEANELFASAAKLDPSCVQALIGLAQLAIVANKPEKSLGVLKQALQLDSKHPHANYLTANLLERSEPEKSISHYKVAATAKELKLLAERRLGIIYFFENSYAEAIEHLSIAVAEGEKSPWHLYLYAYAHASVDQIGKCEKAILKILGASQSDELWAQNAVKAMYSIGMKLFEKQAFNTAYQCFEYVKEHLSISETSPKIDALLEEARFRMSVQLLRDGKYQEALTTLKEIQEATNDTGRERLCRYYSALCELFLNDYAAATVVLDSLITDDKDDPRYLYHKIVAELGAGNDPTAAKLLMRLRDFENIPTHLRVGIQSIRAYLTAKQGKLRSAELSLAAIPELKEQFPGRARLCQNVLLSRILYLCHAKDSKRIHALIPELSDEHKGEATFMHAIAALESGQVDLARNILKPYADVSDKSKSLATVLSTEVALKAVADRDYGKARAIFEEIPDPPENIKDVCLLLSMTESLDQIDDFDQITDTIITITESLASVSDKQLFHTVVHNLGILHLKRAILAEELLGFSRINELWSTCIQHWQEHIFESEDYWNIEQEKIAIGGNRIKLFSPRELEAINKQFVDATFADTFIAYIMVFLEALDQEGIDRHLGLLNRVSEITDDRMVYYSNLRRRYTRYLKKIGKQDERFVTWEFNIATMTVQSAIGEALDMEEAEQYKLKLVSFIRCKEMYESPNEYRDAQKVHNTHLLDALHLGIGGKFSEAGGKLDKLLDRCPPGMLKEEVEAHIRELRESCLRPGDEGDTLKDEFDKIYSLVKNKQFVTETKVLDTHW